VPVGRPLGVLLGKKRKKEIQRTAAMQAAVQEVLPPEPKSTDLTARYLTE
jgi:hypothetical protein